MIRFKTQDTRRRNRQNRQNRPTTSTVLTILDLRFAIEIKNQKSKIENSVFRVLCLVSYVFFASVLYAQEGNEEKDRAVIDLPSVKIEVVDTTQLNIPREKFRSFTLPSPRIYAPLSPKERSWHLLPTSVPEKLREVPVEGEKDFLFSLAANSGIPAVLTYQMLLVREFDRSEALLDMGRSTLRNERTAEGQGNSTFDRLKGVLAHQSGSTSLKMDVQYNAKELGYLDRSGDERPNDRALADLSMYWDQRLSDSVHSSLNIRLSSLRMKGVDLGSPQAAATSARKSDSSGRENGLDLETDFGFRFQWPSSNPVDTGLGIRYFTGENDSEEFREAILRLYLRDSYIRISPFVLGTGIELVLDARENSSRDGDVGSPNANKEDWSPYVYLNPCVVLTSRIGVRTMWQLGLEGYISRRDFKDLYLDREYVRFNPDLDVERTWELNTSLEYRLTRRSNLNVGGFGRHIKNLTIFKETGDGISSWIPDSQNSSMRIFGFSSGWELSLIDDKLKQSFQYVHEFHDQEERIPYRPRDRGSLTITYLAPFGLEPSLSGEFYGTRYADTSGGEPLSGYSLWKAGISKAFGKYAVAFLSAEFYVGRDDYQIWKGYELPSQVVDFGLKLVY